MDSRKRVLRAFLNEFERALRTALLDGVELHCTFGEPTLISVTRPGAGAARLAAVSITLHGVEASVPAPEQEMLPDAGDAVARPRLRVVSPSADAPTAPVANPALAKDAKTRRGDGGIFAPLALSIVDAEQSAASRRIASARRGGRKAVGA